MTLLSVSIGRVNILLLDFSKAFDKVSHSLPFHKLTHYGIQGTLLLWLNSFLKGRSQYVVLENQKASFFRRAPRYGACTFVIIYKYK